jgi:hypothetical protein
MRLNFGTRQGFQWASTFNAGRSDRAYKFALIQLIMLRKKLLILHQTQLVLAREKSKKQLRLNQAQVGASRNLLLSNSSVLYL